MSDAHEEIEKAIAEVIKARRRIAKRKTQQVNAEDERDLLKATSLAWLKNHRLQIALCVDLADIQPIDELYEDILAATARRALRSKYLNDLKTLKNDLVSLRPKVLTANPIAQNTANDEPPDFSSLVPDSKMQGILIRRWRETLRCIDIDASLAATVMMGGLLEALLLARVNQLTDKKPVFTAESAPKDKSGKPLPLDKWTLRHYIDVAYELGWITLSAKNISEVLRDYRNYIHPQKELSHRIQLTQHDTRMFWSVFKNLTTQILESVRTEKASRSGCA